MICLCLPTAKLRMVLFESSEHKKKNERIYDNQRTNMPKFSILQRHLIEKSLKLSAVASVPLKMPKGAQRP
jgi:hypothetical protein